MKFNFLTNDFYADYNTTIYPEICRKLDRPYTQTICNVNGLLFAIPLRSSIEHDNVLWTNKKNGCGLDFSKAVLILDKNKYIDNINRPHIRTDEFKALLGQERNVKMKMEKYITDYKKAKLKIDILHNKRFCEFSTLQYFEEYIYSSTELAEQEAAPSNPDGK